MVAPTRFENAPRSLRSSPDSSAGARGPARYLVRPVLLAGVLVALYFAVSAQQLDMIEQRSLNADYILSRTLKHIELTGIVSVLILLIAVPVGVLLTRERFRRWSGPVLAVANISQAIPSVGLIVLFAVGFIALDVNAIAVIAFVLYGILPVMRNTIAGLQQVDRSVIQAARGMGMTNKGILFTIELPLSVPVMLAGVRTTLTITVGTVALATFVGAGGLGDIISNGIASNRNLVLATGSVIVAVLALLLDWLASIAEDFLRPQGV
jgi:osmoprotectant transport system permease protein